ncbi:MAG: hypothetical protein J1E63_05445 [Muribaculaceae bacterium]|nr:hypothetical protein [Muribaculaceae bacterium]
MMAESTIKMNQMRQQVFESVSVRDFKRYEQKHIKLFNQMSEKYGQSSEEWNEFKQLVDKKIRESEEGEGVKSEWDW